jgi:hypothetical protein
MIIAPLTFVSFLLSLALIDTRNTTLREHYHAAPTPPPSTIGGHIRQWVHTLCYKRSPYASYEPPGTGEKLADGTVQTPGGAVRQGWFWHTKQRKMMRLEVTEAFELRRSMLVLMGFVAVVASYVVYRITALAMRMLL